MSTPAELLTFRAISTEALLMPPSQFLVVGDEFLVTGTLPTKFRKPSVVSLSSKTLPATTASDVAALFDKAHALGSRSLAQFALSIAKLKRVKALAVDLSSTHVRFFHHDERGIVARLFDVRVGSDVLLPRIKRIHAAATVGVSAKQSAPFSLTISAETLAHFPSDDLLMSVYADGILEVEPVNSKLTHAFYCRDQGVAEPYTSFEHETLNRTVYFVSHPSD